MIFDLDLEITWWTKISQHEILKQKKQKTKQKNNFLLSFSNVTLTLTFRRSLQIQCHIFLTFVSYTTYLKLSKQIFRQFCTKLFEK